MANSATSVIVRVKKRELYEEMVIKLVTRVFGIKERNEFLKELDKLEAKLKEN